MDFPRRHPQPRSPALKADPFAQLRLIDLQELDTRIDGLRHQLANLPQESEIRALLSERSDIADQAAAIGVKVDDLNREQKKADADVEQVKARRDRDQDRLDKGLVTKPADLEHLQSELISLARRITELEDVELEVMEALEAAQSRQQELQETLTALTERARALTEERDEAASRLRAQMEDVAAERSVTASGLAADLLALYDKLRDSKGGVGAAALRQRRCGGCGLELSPADLSAIRARASDDVVRCEECSRILVRTAESGL